MLKSSFVIIVLVIGVPLTGFLSRKVVVTAMSTQYEDRRRPLENIAEKENYEPETHTSGENVIQDAQHQNKLERENNGINDREFLPDTHMQDDINYSSNDMSHQNTQGNDGIEAPFLALADTNHKTPTDDKFTCKFIITPESQDRFMELTDCDKGKKNFIYVHLNFSTQPELPKGPALEKVFFPWYLTWTFKGEPGAGYPLLGYPFNYDILSMGFLYWHVKENFTININVMPPGCKSTWGERNMMTSLLQSVRKLSGKIKYNDTTVWCYSVKYEIHHFRKWLNHVTGVNRDANGFQCSEPEDPHRFSVNREQTRLLVILQVIGCVLFTYMPLLLYVFDEGTPGRMVPKKEIPMGYEQLEGTVDGGHVDYAGDDSDDEDGEILHLGTEAPITFLGLLKTACLSRTCSQSVILLRIKKCLAILVIAPSIIALEIIFTFIYKKKALYVRILSDVPIGFFAIPFGYELSSRNWLYFLGGPYVIYSLYFLFAVVLSCLPVNLCEVLATDIDKDRQSGCMLFITSDIIEDLGGVKYTQLSVSYRKLSKAFTARLYTLLHHKFWVMFKNVWVGRIKAVSKRLPFQGLLKLCVCLTICLPMWLVLFLLFLLDIISCIVYFGVPIVFFTKIVAQNYMRYVLDRFLYDNTRGHYSGEDISKRIAGWIIRITLVVILTYVFFCAYTMYTVTVTAILHMSVFTIVGIVAFPSEAIVSVLGTGIVFMYIYKTLRGFNDGYNDLLLYTITLSEELNTEQILKNSATGETVKYITKRSVTGIPGVPAHVYYSLVESFRPLRVQVFLTFIYLGLIAAFMYVCIYVIHSYNREAELSVLVKTVATVIAGILPHLVQLCWGSVNQDAKNLRYKLQIKASIRAHWERHNLYIQET
ncbi:unnamed protein product [Owenia fusiformis]|uniref:Uncharacterized protein n=1 Tax=Owenia fusiformis TaxID=6347 RepID=A0A8J1U4A1_OWEFU|nr:unnamed protein product [Owenia fusiformis]